MRKVGSGRFVYDEVKHWGEFPAGWTTEDAPAVAVDSEDRLYVLIRNKDGVLIFDRQGRFLRSWGEGLFVRPHGLFIAPGGEVFVVDDRGHSVFKFTPDGEQLLLIQTKDTPADTGYVTGEKPVERAGPPFNEPTGCALARGGDIYVTDGYGNARVHRFTPSGELMYSWGEPGSGPGEFDTVHGVCVDENGLVYISDRMNARVQIFSPEGEYLSEWSDVRFPNNMCLDAKGNRYVAEMGCVLLYGREPVLDRPPARITVRDASGRVLSEWSEDEPQGPGRFFAPHSIAVDSHGDVYVSEVTTSYNFGTAPEDWGVLRKYIRS